MSSQAMRKSTLSRAAVSTSMLARSRSKKNQEGPRARRGEWEAIYSVP